MNKETYPHVDELVAPASADAVHSVLRFLKVVLHRKMYLAGCLAIAAMLGGFYYFTATRLYEAHAELLILQTGNDVWSPQMMGQGSRDALLPTYERLFDSAVVLEGSIKQLLEMTPEYRVDFAGVPRDKWVDVLRGNLSASSIRRTNVLEIRYRSKSALAAEAVVHTVVRSYLDFMEKNHKDVSAEIATILEQERREIEQKLALKQQELIDVQKRVRDLGISENQNVTHPAVQRVIRLSESLVQVQQDRVDAETSLASLRVAVRDGSDLRHHLHAVEPLVGREMLMSALGLNAQDSDAQAHVERQLMQDRARLEGLVQHYGDAHPKVVETMRAIQSGETYLEEMQTKFQDRLEGLDNRRLGPLLQTMVEEKLASLWEHESKLSQQYEQAESEAVDLNDRMALKRIVEHDVERLRGLHDTLLDRIANIDIGKDHSNVRVGTVSDPKASRLPVSPKLHVVAFLVLVGGTSVGLALIYVMDVLDDRFRSPEELQEQLQAPLLAMIRDLQPPGEFGPEALQVHVAPESVESEAFRTLRTTLAFSGQGLERLAVTSTEPGDGKTTVLANLGVSYAHAGKRTLLIDCDLRRPGLTRLFAMRSQHGVSDVLRSDEDIAAMCRDRVLPTGVERLDILPCGPKPSNPAELLSSTRLADLLGWADGQYDQVLMDCPPILAASDAAIVGLLSDSLLLVIQPTKNHRRLVLRAVHGLASIGVQIGGIVANKISDDARSGYYGYGGYGYGYGYGYGQDEGDPLQEDHEDGDDFLATGELDSAADRQQREKQLAA